MRAIVVDKDYGSVTTEELERVSAAYQAASIQVELLEYQVEAARQKEPTEEEIIAGCQGAQVLLATGNPPITRKVMEKFKAQEEERLANAPIEVDVVRRERKQRPHKKR